MSRIVDHDTLNCTPYFTDSSDRGFCSQSTGFGGWWSPGQIDRTPSPTRLHNGDSRRKFLERIRKDSRTMFIGNVPESATIDKLMCLFKDTNIGSGSTDGFENWYDVGRGRGGRGGRGGGYGFLGGRGCRGGRRCFGYDGHSRTIIDGDGLNIKSIRIPRDKETDIMKRVAFVEYNSVELRDAAIEAGPYEMDGNKLICRKAEDPRPGKGSASKPRNDSRKPTTNPEPVRGSSRRGRGGKKYFDSKTNKMKQSSTESISVFGDNPTSKSLKFTVVLEGKQTGVFHTKDIVAKNDAGEICCKTFDCVVDAQAWVRHKAESDKERKTYNVAVYDEEIEEFAHSKTNGKSF